MSQTGRGRRDAIDQIEIRTPCSISWGELRAEDANGRVRSCGRCGQNVYNLEEVSRLEAHRLLTAREGRVCVRILRRPDGTVVTAGCRARLRAARRSGIFPFLGVMMLVGLTEIITIGAGLSRLRSLLAWAPLRMGLTVSRPSPQPKVPEVGGVVPRNDLTERTMGEIEWRPDVGQP